MQTRTVEVRRLSDLATEREVHEFFSFSGEIEHVEIRRETGQSKTAYVTFKDPQALEIALLLSGATIVDQVVAITPAEDYVPQSVIQEVRIVDNAISMSHEDTSPVPERKLSPNNGRVYVTKAQDVMSNMIAKGSVLGQDAVNKAKAFDEKHRLTASASARVASFDQRVGLTEKLTVGISVVNEKVKSVDQKYQVSDRTMSAIMAAEKKINDTGSAVKSSRYVMVGTTWLNGAFSKMARAGQVAGTKTREKWSSAVSNLTSKDIVDHERKYWTIHQDMKQRNLMLQVEQIPYHQQQQSAGNSGRTMLHDLVQAVLITEHSMAGEPGSSSDEYTVLR